MQKLFRFLAYTSLITTFLVILAGSVVRTTQSGMGCPDWPKCFGYYIPPTADAQVRYESGKSYAKGMMVIENDTLWRANSDLIASPDFDRTQWEKYPKHDYSDFVVHQTWIEYINRLLGALLGIFVFGMFASSFSFRKSKPILILLSFALVFVTGFQAWLGKLVVDGNLIPESITIHMVGALLLIILAQLVINILNKNPSKKSNPTLRNFAFISLATVVIQLLIGTQVREEIDVIAKQIGFSLRSEWVEQLSSTYLIHRSFSLVVALLVAYTGYLAFKTNDLGMKRLGIACMTFVGVEILAGIILGFAGMPAFFQPVHLLFATLLIWITYSIGSRKMSV